MSQIESRPTSQQAQARDRHADQRAATADSVQLKSEGIDPGKKNPVDSVVMQKVVSDQGQRDVAQGTANADPGERRSILGALANAFAAARGASIDPNQFYKKVKSAPAGPPQQLASAGETEASQAQATSGAEGTGTNQSSKKKEEDTPAPAPEPEVKEEKERNATDESPQPPPGP